VFYSSPLWTPDVLRLGYGNSVPSLFLLFG
jgi:hypothetical protein